MIHDDISDEWQPPVYIISGEPGEGKTTFLMEILKALSGTDIRLRGFVAPGYFHDGLRSGFSVIDVATGISEELCSAIPFPGCEQHGRFYFRAEGLSLGHKALLDHLIPDMTDLLVIDEVGRFEMKGEVWSDCIDTVVKRSFPPMIWTVRCNLVEAVINKWSLRRAIVITLGSMTHNEFMDDLLKEVRIYRSHIQSNDP